MKISLTGPAFRSMDKQLGYGQASFNIYKSLQALGIDVGIETLDADIEICFSHPQEYTQINPKAYKINYTAWESTDLSPEWKRNVGRCHELWATSNWVANVWENLFPGKQIFVYKHGINSIWKPEKRTESHKPFTFLHVGEPYSRKDGQLVVNTFIELFGDDPNYRLVLKTNGMNTIQVLDPRHGFFSSPSAAYENIVTIDGFLTDDQMVGLHSLCDVFVYPSWGEGWGLQPIQALASGMPVISTDGWADYARYITWRVDSRWSYSPWQNIHQGLMMQPEKSHLKEQMLNSVKDYKSVLDKTYNNALSIHKDYDWIEQTKPAVARLEKIYENIKINKENNPFST